MAKQVLSDLDFNGVSRQLNLPAPLSPNEPARLADLNSAIEGLSWKDASRVATQSNINLASPGDTIDGIIMVANDRVLVKAQTTAAENGIYIWNGTAIPMTRAFDANTTGELEQAITAVEEGTNAGVSFRQTSVNFVIGTDVIAFTTFGSVAPPASQTTQGVIQIASQTDVDTGTNAVRAVTPLTLALSANRKRFAAVNIGDGSATQFNVTHNFGTFDLHVAVYRNVAPRDEILCDVERPDTTQIRLRFATAPTANQYRVVILG